MVVVLGGSDKDRLTRIFCDLAEGGGMKMQFASQPWGADSGRLTDKYVITWLVHVDGTGNS